MNYFTCPADRSSISTNMSKKHRNHCVAITRLAIVMVFRDRIALCFK